MERFDETEEDLKNTMSANGDKNNTNANPKEFEIRGELSKTSYFIEEPIEGFVEIVAHRSEKSENPTE